MRLQNSAQPRTTRGLGCALALIVFVAFARLCVAEFTIWDDAQNISQNPWMKQPWPQIVKHYFGTSEFGLYIPVTYGVWATLAKLASTSMPDATGNTINSWVFHTFNVLLHVVNALLVFRLILRLIGQGLAAFFGAMVFALHPVQVETVGWVSGGKDLLCWFGVALGLNIYSNLIELKQSKSVLQFWRDWRFAAVLALMIVAILSKPTAMVMSALLVVVDHFFNRTPLRQAVVRAIPMFAISVGAIWLTKVVQVASDVEEPTSLGKLLVAGDALTHYLSKVFLPINLGFDYGRSPQAVLAMQQTKWIWIIPVILAVLVLACRRRWPALTGAGAIFLISVSPLLGFVPFMFQSYSTVSDHYMYFMLVGVALAVSFGLSHIKENRQWLFAPVIIVLAIMSFRQCPVWHDNVSLNENGIRVNPVSFSAYNHLGVAQGAGGRPVEAIANITRAIEINPRLVSGYTNRAQIYAEYLRDYPRAIADFEQAIHLLRDSKATPHGIASAFIKLADAQMKNGEFAAAGQSLDDAARLVPDHPELESARKSLERLRPEVSPPS